MSYESNDLVHDDIQINNARSRLLYTRSPIESHHLNPHLSYISSLRTILTEPETGENGEITWRDLHQRVQPFHNPMEFSENIHQAVYEFIKKKIPNLKNRIPVLRHTKGVEISDDKLLDAIVNNQFDESLVPEGQRKEVLLSVAALIVEKIETHTQRELLERASPDELQSLGLNPGIRNLLVETLDISEKADPLFIRFLAYSNLTPNPSEGTPESEMFLPGDETAYTSGALFPKESTIMAQRLKAMAGRRNEWQGLDTTQLQEGAGAFRDYILSLVDLYTELDTAQVAERRNNVFENFKRLYKSNFPIGIAPATEPSVKDPYYDPEMKVYFEDISAREDQRRYAQARNAMAGSLGHIGQSRFAQNVRDIEVKSVIALGNYGIDLTFNVVAQEKPYPLALMYTNEQFRQYDQYFPEFMERVVETNGEFDNLSIEERIKFQEFMCRMNTVLHEYSHSVYPEETDPDKNPNEDELRARLGDKQLRIIDEIKADIVYISILPEIVSAGGLEGSREQWAIAALANELQVLKDDDGSDDPYFMAARYVLNNLLSSGAVNFDENQKRFVINNYDDFDSAMKKAAENLLSLYDDPTMNPTLALSWLNDSCRISLLSEDAKNTLR